MLKPLGACTRPSVDSPMRTSVTCASCPRRRIGTGFGWETGASWSYTPVQSYYRLMTVVEDDPELDKKRAQRKLRRYVESHEHAIRQNAEIMVDHFLEPVIPRKKIGGKARAMVATSGGGGQFPSWVKEAVFRVNSAGP